MADPDGELTVAQRLGRALDSGLLPAGGPAEAAERLIERLERPARVALLGLPGSGKSSILNLLVGALVVPETLRLPTIIVQHGSEARMICTLADGTSRIVPGLDLANVLSLAPALVTLEMDLPALKVISLLEVSAGPMETEQRRAATWAAKRADIVVWCTTSYLPKEQSVWESLPDSVKDNSFMFLTKVDLLGNRASASAMHNRVELRAGEEFRQILSISARQARAAMPAGGPVNRELFRDSGASAVIAAIKTRVQSGRRADMDTAELLLARHAEASEFVARRFAEPGDGMPAAPVWNPPPEPEDPAEAAGGSAAEVMDAVSAAVAATDDQIEPPIPTGAEAEEVKIEPAENAASEAFPESGGENADLKDDPARPALEDAEPATRRRFADRIKRVANSPDAAPAPLVPLRSTWKSKAELEAPPEPEPEPTREPERIRRPRPSQPVAQDEGDVARMLASVALKSEPDLSEAADSADAGSELHETVTPPRSAGPSVFGARRSDSVTALEDATSAEPGPSTLREWPEPEDPTGSAMQVSSAGPDLDGPGAEAEDDEPDADMEPTAEAQDSVQLDDSTDKRFAALAGKTAEDRPVDRPRLFDRQSRVRPVEPAERPVADARPTAPPLTRLPAPPRAAVSRSEPDKPGSLPRPAADDAQFSPRAIMARERPIDAETAAPRRERPRIAARAVAVSAPAVAVDVPPIETDLVESALLLIVARSADLQGVIDPESKVPVDTILDHTRETTERVMEIIARAQSDELRRINGDLSEVLDLILLMQLEKGHAPADDALTLILQLRRELETLRAA